VSASYPGTELELFQHATNWKAYFARFMRPYIGGDVLEVGAGVGATTEALMDAPRAPAASRRHATERWLCVEPDPTLAATALERVPPSCEVVVGTTADLDPAPQFDTILYIDVLEHLDDDRGELARAASLLRDGGHLVVLVPAHQWLFTRFDAAIGHRRRYDRAMLAAAMPPSLARVASRYLDSAGVLLSLANRFVLRSPMPTSRQIAFWNGAIIPISRVVDPLLAYAAGKSLLEVRKKNLKPEA